MKKIFSLLFILITFNAKAQISLNVPPNSPNTRFYSDIFNIKRPALSVVGFDNGGDNSKGYGLKQILEKLYNGTANSLMVRNFNQIVHLANEDLNDPFNTPDKTPLTVVNNNSNKLQCRAFVALARYILLKNGIKYQISDTAAVAPPDSVAISALHDAFLKPEDWLLANLNHTSDEGKWTRSIDNYARAVDLYLALENAFYYYGGADRAEYNDPNSTVLLSKTQKKMVMLRLFNEAHALHFYEYSNVTWLDGYVEFYEAEAGNRPMKIFLSMGYAALTLQNFEPSGQYIPYSAKNYLQEAFRSGALQEPKNSIKYLKNTKNYHKFISIL